MSINYVFSNEIAVNIDCLFTFGEDSMLSSAEAVIKFGPVRNQY